MDDEIPSYDIDENAHKHTKLHVVRRVLSNDRSTIVRIDTKIEIMSSGIVEGPLNTVCSGLH